MKVTACLLVALVALVAFASADHTLGQGFSTNVRMAEITADQESVVCGDVNDFGLGFCTLTQTTLGANSFSCSVSHNIADITMAHVHDGEMGQDGPVVIGFMDVSTPGYATLTGSLPDRASIDDFLNGGFYFNLHNVACASGVIRGQLLANHNFYGDLSEANEIPPSGSDAHGVGLSFFDASDNEIRSQISHTVVNPTGAHIHTGNSLVNGDVTFAFADPTSVIDETFTFPSNGAVRPLFEQNDSGMYFNVHSNAVPSGEIRSQLHPADAIPRINYAFELTGSQEVPAVASSFGGAALVWVDAASGFMEYVIYHSIPNGQVTGAHLHLGAAGSNGAIQFNLAGFDSPIRGSATLSQVDMDNLADGLFYFNIHTAVNPSGEIRGQIVQTNSDYAYLSGTQEVPAVTTAFGGVAFLNLVGSQLSFTVYHDVQGANAFHIHDATVGINGAVIFDLTSDLDDPVFGGSVTLNADQLSRLPSGAFYFNMHTAAVPTGIVRGQILPVAAALVAGGGGDPHFLGFDGSDYDFRGVAGEIFNLITDRDLQVNFQLVDFPSMRQLYNSFIGTLGFVTINGDSIIFDAGNAEVEPTVSINGDVFLATELGNVDGRSFSIKKIENHSVPSHLNFPAWHTVGEVFTITFDHYTFELFLVDLDEKASGVMRFFDFTTALSGTGHNPHGTLGRTLAAGSHARDVGAFGSSSDFKVADGILGSDFAFNRFALE